MNGSKDPPGSYDFDLIIIGGGSGGLAAAKEAAKFDKKVLVLDFVTPTPLGTRWGLGGTCVNVGCIPKKLMHQAALLGQALKDSRNYGWKVEDTVKHDWEKMTESVQSHIGSLNWGYRVALREKKVVYENAYGKLELTPVAIQAGRLLAQRLYGGSNVKCDYDNVPTTVFTPLEYGCCGLSEEKAVEKFGEENIEVYHSFFWPLEWTVPSRDNNKCYAKIICNLKDDERVVGFHVLGPNAGEVTQGFAAALKCGLTKQQLDSTIGIHPVCAEIFTTLSVTKRSGGDILQSGC